MGSFSASMSAPKKAEWWQSEGIYKERSGQDGFQGLMVRNFVTGLLRNCFVKWLIFSSFLEQEWVSKGFFGGCMRLYIARRLIVYQEIEQLPGLSRGVALLQLEILIGIRFCQCQGIQVLNYYESVQRWVQKEEKFLALGCFKCGDKWVRLPENWMKRISVRFGNKCWQFSYQVDLFWCTVQGRWTKCSERRTFFDRSKVLFSFKENRYFTLWCIYNVHRHGWRCAWKGMM